jgi:hypothetical protein
MIRDRIVVGIKDANLSVKILKKATDMARQSESVRKQQSLVRNGLCDNLLVAQHFAKCPMFEHLKHFTPFAGQLSLEWFWRCPHIPHLAPFCWLLCDQQIR